MKQSFLVLLFVALSMAGFSQQISFSGNFGIASPQGTAFQTDGEDDAKGGLGYSADILYHLGKFNDKLAIGGIYNSSLMLGVGGDEGLFGAELYALTLYGVKGYYKFFSSKVTPYVSLSAGLSSFETPTWYVDNVEIPGEKAFSLGLMPEIGLQLGGFVISATYSVPMKYKFETWDDTAGALQVMIGYRYTLDI